MQPATELRHEGGESDSASALLESVIQEAHSDLMRLQQDDGHWVFELEADATIPAEYILLRHFLGNVDREVERQLGVYLRSLQGAHGGWPLFYDGAFNISATVKAYFALKLIGDDAAAPHMVRAREAVLAHGGAERSNVFTRITLALFGQVPWRAVPVMPVEIMLLPRWFPFHLSKISYWSRTVLVPLLVLMAKRPLARNPRGVNIRELFRTPPEEVHDYLQNPTRSAAGEFFLTIDRALRVLEPIFPRGSRDRAIKKALDFVTVRLNGDDGLGGIFPAMANTVMVFDALDYPADHPDFKTARAAVDKLLTLKGDWGYCQPCLSPIWDTGLAALAAIEAGAARESESIRSAGDWLTDLQVTEVVGDWADWRPGLRPGGWAFQYRNDYYPDVDDTAVVAMALDRIGGARNREAVERAAEWVVGMQSKNGGWGAFDADNSYNYLDHIPFADHGALLDPPTADVTARCVSFLCQIGHKAEDPAIAKALRFLRDEQEEDGSWFGRWGTNYVYGTWSVLSALNAAGEPLSAPYIRRAVEWLKSRQRSDGGWGEDGASYDEARKDEAKASTPSQTAWAVLALMAVGEVHSDAVKRGVEFLVKAPREGAVWEEPWFTAVGFPKVFYLRYHGYCVFFPLMALARYRNLTTGNDLTVAYGM